MNKWLIVAFIFLFSVSLRLWNLNQMGKTWDEDAYVQVGYKLIQLVKKGDFGNSHWYKISDAPPLARYAYGLIGQFDIDHFLKNGDAVFKYDLTASRILSAIVSSLASVVVLLIGWQFISKFVGVIAAIIFTMLPFFLGLSQLATLESFIVLFFTSSVYSFLLLIRKFSIKKMFMCGILIGLAISTKYTNVLLIPLLIFIYTLWRIKSKNKNNKLSYTKLLLIFTISIVVFFLLWPMPWFHLSEVLEVNYKLRILGTRHSIPEVFFGKLLLVPKIYYLVHFLITTPLIILGLFLVGLKHISDEKKFILYSMVAWFVLPFALSFYNFRQHGIRYIIEIYSPLALIAAIGFDYLASKVTGRTFFRIILFIPIVIYLFVILIKITPYYLDYFNIVVGGTRNVYEKKLFQLGWWGQGIKEATNYIINNAPKNSRVGYAISPINSLPPLTGFDASDYKDGQRYDYVMVNYFHVLREGFDDSNIRLNYKEVYSVNADGAILVSVYKRK